MPNKLCEMGVFRKYRGVMSKNVNKEAGKIDSKQNLNDGAV